MIVIRCDEGGGGLLTTYMVLCVNSIYLSIDLSILLGDYGRQQQREIMSICDNCYIISNRLIIRLSVCLSYEPTNRRSK